MRLAVLAVAPFALVLAPGLARPAAAQTGTCSLPAFTAPVVAGTAGTAPFDVAAGDFDGDGFADIATGGQDGAAVLLGDGTGRFGPATLFARGLHVAVADFNADGDADLAVTWTSDEGGTLTAGVDVRIGDGAGGFGPAVTLPAGEVVSDIAAADYDGNGTIDLAVTESRASQVLLFAGDGAGAFASPTVLQFTYRTAALAWGDVDGDGDPDLAVTTANGSDPFDGAVEVLLGDGAGVFTPMPPLFHPLPPREIALADFTGDGLLDLATLNAPPEPAARHLTIFRGAGDGTFVLDHATEVLGEPTGLDAADFTGDGVSDVLVRDGDGVTTLVQIFVNTDPGAWPGRAFQIPTADPGGVAAADLDGDGRADVVAPGDATDGNVITMRSTCGDLADLAISVTGPTGPIVAGRDEITYTFTVQNLGPDAADARMAFAIPGSFVAVDLLSAAPSAGSCVHLTPNERAFQGDVALCTLGTLAPGSAATVAVQLATHPTDTEVHVYGLVGTSTTDPNSANNAAAARMRTRTIGGRNLTASADPLGGTQLVWDSGTAQAGYVIGRLVNGVTTVLPADGVPLPPGATTFIDPAPVAGRANCYVLTPIDAAGEPLARSDMLCVVPGTASGDQRPEVFTIRIQQNAPVLHWSDVAAATGYVMWRQYTDTGETSTHVMPGTTNNFFDSGTGRPACYGISAYSGSTPLGHADVLCAVPGFSTFPELP